MAGLEEVAPTPHQLLCASEGSDGCEGEDAVVQGGGVVVVLQHRAEQLQQLPVVRLERLRVGLHHLVQQKEAHLSRCDERRWNDELESILGIILGILTRVAKGQNISSRFPRKLSLGILKIFHNANFPW